MKRPSAGTVESDRNNPHNILAPHKGYHIPNPNPNPNTPFKKKYSFIN